MMTMPRLPLSQWPILLAPVLLGAVVSVLIVLDPVIGHELHLYIFDWYLPRVVPYFFPAVALVAALSLTWVLWHGEALFSERDRWYIVALFGSLALSGVNYGPLDATKAAILLVLFAWLTDMFVQRRPFRLSPIMSFLLLGLAFFTLASVFNGRGSSLAALHTIFSKLLLFVLLVNVIRTRELLQVSVRLVMVLGALTGVAALAQEALFYFFGYPLTFDDNGSNFWFKETMWGSMLRASAFHYTPQSMVHFLIVPLTLVLFTSASWLYLLTAVAIMGTAVVFSFSLGGLFVFCLLILLAPFFRHPHRTMHYASGLVAMALIAYQAGAVKWVQEHALSIGEKSGEDRMELLQLGFEAIQAHPWIGIGLNNFNRLSTLAVHNSYIQISSEIGLIGGLIFVLIVGSQLVRLFRLRTQARTDEDQALTNAFLLGGIGIAVHFFMEPFVNSMVSWSYLALMEAVILNYRPASRIAARPAKGIGAIYGSA